jgi:hypothetical protein
MKKGRVLEDHKKIGKRFVPPFVHQLGAPKEISWVRTILPELAWIAFVHRIHGDATAVKLITALARSARHLGESNKQKAYAAATDFTSESRGSVLKRLDKSQIADLQSALEPLLVVYPRYPLARVFSIRRKRIRRQDIEIAKKILGDLFYRSERFPMMVQATATWLLFDADLLKVASHLPLAKFPEIENYPETELSQRVGSGVRSTVNMMFSAEENEKLSFDLSSYFWNRGIEISRCEVANEKK